MEIKRSEIEISKIDNNSVLTTSKIFRPLKIFSLQKKDACQIVFSNYGGGFVEGDQILLDISCREDTSTVFTTQANTRIYRSESHKASVQEIHGRVGKGSFTVYMGDPIVPHHNSIFEQKLYWQLEEDSTLLILDWFEGGRILNGERFAFNSFLTDLRIDMKGNPIIWDRFRLNPDQNNPNSPGAFLNHSSYLNIFLAGNENLERIKQIENHLNFISSKYLSENNHKEIAQVEMIGSACKVNENVYMIRCSARGSDKIQPFVKEIAKALSDKGLLGFNPLEGKI